eukprot:1086838-Amphidinium_carterae.1
MAGIHDNFATTTCIHTAIVPSDLALFMGQPHKRERKHALRPEMSTCTNPQNIDGHFPSQFSLCGLLMLYESAGNLPSTTSKTGCRPACGMGRISLSPCPALSVQLTHQHIVGLSC